MQKFQHLWGLPVYKTSINSNSYDKQKLVETIENNYSKQAVRQNWSKSYFRSDIHHSVMDENNPKFKKPDYSSVEKAYQAPVTEFIQNLNIKNPVNVKHQVVNYTAAKHASLLEPHIHTECEFSLVHYVKFDKTENSPTILMNPYAFQDYWERKSKLMKIVHTENVENSWLFDEWAFSTDEDDILIFPAIMKHYVKNDESKNLRITLSANINVNKGE
tara:strand:- start:344 stop:994 length:651 start_codon:yes stop_codon:yes gene_type:complete